MHIDDRLKKTILFTSIGVVVGLLIFGIYSLAKLVVDKSYNSDEVVMEEFVKEQLKNPMPVIDSNSITLKNDEGYENVIQIYDSSNLIQRCQEFLGEKYPKYIDIFLDVERNYTEYFGNVSSFYEYPKDIELEYGDNFCADYADGLSSLDNYDVFGIGEKWESVEAVYFLNNTSVIYKTKSTLLDEDKDEVAFIVVDYSNVNYTGIPKLVDYGGIYASDGYMYKDNTYVTEINGFKVYFTYGYNGV